MTLYQQLLAFMSFFSSLSLKAGWTSDTLIGWGRNKTTKHAAKWHCLTFKVRLKKFSHFLLGFPGTLFLGRASHHLKTPAPQKLLLGNPNWLYKVWCGIMEWAPSSPEHFLSPKWGSCHVTEETLVDTGPKRICKWFQPPPRSDCSCMRDPALVSEIHCNKVTQTG